MHNRLPQVHRVTMPDFYREKQRSGLVCGVDEAGRGPWAGPVVAAALHFLNYTLIPDSLLAMLDDSKKLSARKRIHIFNTLTAQDQKLCVFGIGVASVKEIDTINILQATLLAMQRAVKQIPVKIDHALVDGISSPSLPCTIECIPKGDSLSFSIAGASVIAKVYRDQLMSKLATQYPGYGWEKNVGYGTKEHRDGLLNLGVTPHHRHSFAPIKLLLQRAA